MWKNYLKIAWRTLWKQKGITAINVCWEWPPAWLCACSWACYFGIK